MLQTGKIVSVIFNDANYVDKVELNLGDYEIIEEHGKAYAVKKKKEYPKTYEECCKVLGYLCVDLCFNADYTSFNASKEQWKRLGLMNQFYQLIICRDAYWKIAGEEMGLGKPWEPDWIEDSIKYTIQYGSTGIVFPRESHMSRTFTFPTEEMRDAFYENFKDLIESCKELL